MSCGYWRIPSTKQYATPVITFFDDYGDLVVRFPVGSPFLGTSEATDLTQESDGDKFHKFAGELWPRCQAVSTDEHEAALGETQRWADDLPIQPRDGIGGNNPPEDEVEKLLREARENEAKAKKLVAGGAAKSQKGADAAANLIKAMSGQRGDLGEAHKKEKEPHLEAGRAVDAKFLTLINSMKLVGVDLKKAVIDPYLIEKERVAKVAAEAAQKVLDDAAKAEREKELAEAKEKGEPVTDEQWEAAAPQPDAAPAVTVTAAKVSAGARGAKASLKDIRSGVVDNYETFAAALGRSRNSELLTLLDQIGHKMARAAVADAKDGDTIYPGLKLKITRGT